MPGAAATATNILWTYGIREQGRNPVAQFNPRNRGLGNRVVLTGHMQDFGPEPFAGINTADIAGVIDLARCVAQTGNFFSFFY